MLRKRPGVHLDGVGLGSGRQGRGVGAQAAPEGRKKLTERDTSQTWQERRRQRAGTSSLVCKHRITCT